MAAPFVVACSNCSAKLKLKDKSKVGKKVRCPKCSEPFVIQDPAAAGDDGGFFDEPEDDWGNDFGDLEEDFAPAPRKKKSKNSKKGSKKKGKKRGKKNSGMSGGLIAAFAGGGILFLALIAAGVYFLLPILLGTGTVANRMQWLPNDTQTYVEIRVADIWESNVLKPIRTSKMAQEMEKKLSEEGEMKIKDIEKIVMGIPVDSKKPIVIIYSKIAIDLNKLDPGMTTSSYAGYKIFEHTNGQNVGFLLNSKTMVTGSKEQIHAAIDRKGECAVADDFDFVPTRGGIVFGSLSPGSAMQQSPAGKMTRGSFETEKMKSIAGAIKFTSDLNISLTMTYEDTTSAQAALTQAQEQLDKQKEQQKQQSASSSSPAQAGPMQSLQEGTQKVMDSVKLSGSGDQFSTKLTVSGSLVEDGVKMLEQFGGGAGLIPGMGSPF